MNKNFFKIYYFSILCFGFSYIMFGLGLFKIAISGRQKNEYENINIIKTPQKIGSNLYFISKNNSKFDSHKTESVNICLKDILKTENFKIKNLNFTNDGVYVILE